MYTRRIVCLVMVLSLLSFSSVVFAGGGQEVAGAIKLEVVADQPEYEAQARELWDLYVEDNPNVEVNVISVNEDQVAAFTARLAAGDAPHLGMTVGGTTKSNYTNFANLLEIDFQHWDNFSFNARTIYDEMLGIEDYVPAIQPFGTFRFSFIYYDDEMRKAGVDMTAIRTWDDVDAVMSELKNYVDTTEGLEYVLDTGWHSWVWMRCLMPILSLSLGRDLQEHRDLWLGEIDWSDLRRNPLVPVLEKLKEYTDKGYLPEDWWTRAWESEYEVGFINRKSILTLHGPWMWTKTLAANPGAELSGAPLPAGPGGKLAAFPVTPEFGSGIYAAWVGTPEMDEVVKAFNWLMSPEILELQAQYIGMPPNLKTFSDTFELDFSQFQEMVRPSLRGTWGDVSWVNEAWGPDVAGPYKVEGRPDVMMDDIVVSELEKYFEGSISIADLMEYFKDRWEAAYQF